MIDSSYAGWSELCCYEIGTRIVAHLTAKSLVGYPLCRDPELIELFAAYGNAVPVSGFFISMFPEVMKPYIPPHSPGKGPHSSEDGWELTWLLGSLPDCARLPKWQAGWIRCFSTKWNGEMQTLLKSQAYAMKGFHTIWL